MRTNGMAVELAGMALACMIGVGGLAAPTPARAFCGFYVAGGGADLFNNATQVVLMRDGTRTVLSMQNNYQGPVADFAMVVPVPVVLSEDDVKTLPKDIFTHIDKLAAPRLVEYWEQDPCAPARVVMPMARAMAGAPMARRRREASAADLGVTIEAKFTVGEYKILILSAKDSTGLQTWLRQEKYRIPDGAAKLLTPYVQSGMKFFVAKVDVKKVKFEGGMAQLSPLRFHYDSDDFSLPIRLGMMNSAGTQDLIVHILSPDSRYVVANYDNVSIPTNLDLAEPAKQRFGEFYAALFDDTVAKHPGAVVTEYAWDASTCDPCPTPALRPDELQTLGADVLWQAPKPIATGAPNPAPNKPAPNNPADPLQLIQPQQRRVAPPPPRRRRGGFILTRLHARYGKGDIASDLVFEKAKAIAGGREHIVADGVLEQGAVDSPVNNFQARYAIRHAWTGPIECENPVRNRWGGPPGGETRPIRPATDLAFAPRGKLQASKLVQRGAVTPVMLHAAKAAEPTTPANEAAPPEPAAQPGKPAMPTAEPSETSAANAPVARAKPSAKAESNAEEDCSVSRPGQQRASGALWGMLLCGVVLAMRRRRRGGR